MDWIGRLLRSRRAGEDALAWHRPGLDSSLAITVTSPDFQDCAPIPKRHAGRPIGENISPALEWSGVPPTAQELVLIVEDADVPFSRPIVHAIARLAPNLTDLAEGDLDAGGAHGEGRGSFDRPGYHGPRPIPGHGPHHYVFQLFALDRPIPGDSTLRPRTIMAAMSGQVLARGRLTGTYER